MPPRYWSGRDQDRELARTPRRTATTTRGLPGDFGTRLANRSRGYRSAGHPCPSTDCVPSIIRSGSVTPQVLTLPGGVSRPVRDNHGFCDLREPRASEQSVNNCSRRRGNSRCQQAAKPLKNQQDATPALSYEPGTRTFESCRAHQLLASQVVIPNIWRHRGQRGPSVSMDPLDSLFQQFLGERIYLKNVTPKTRVWHDAGIRYQRNPKTGC